MLKISLIAGIRGCFCPYNCIFCKVIKFRNVIIGSCCLWYFNEGIDVMINYHSSLSKMKINFIGSSLEVPGAVI